MLSLYYNNIILDNLVLATHNKGKIEELKHFLTDSAKKTQQIINLPKILTAQDFALTAPLEDGQDFAENAYIKANYVSQKVNLPCLADDSGLSIAALGDFPGIKSADLARKLAPLGRDSDFEAAQKYILAELTRIGALSPEQRQAKFICSLCLKIPQEEAIYFTGVVQGVIANEILGKNGFGYDAIFIPRGSNLTFAQMSQEQKANFPTHRNVALTKLVEVLLKKSDYAR